MSSPPMHGAQGSNAGHDDRLYSAPLILLPLVAGMAAATLWLWRRLQPGMTMGSRERGEGGRCGADGHDGPARRRRFSGKRYLVGVSRGRMDLIAEPEIPRARATMPAEVRRRSACSRC